MSRPAPSARLLHLLIPLTWAALLLPWPRSAQAAVVNDGDISHSDSNKSRLAFDATVGSGADRFVLVSVTTANAATPATSVVFAGAPLAFIGGSTSPAGNCRVEWWGLANPMAGSHQLEFTLPSSPGHLSAALVSYHGVSPMRPTAGFAANAGLVGPSSVVVGGSPGDVVLDAVCGWAADSIIDMAGAKQTARWHWSTGSLSAAGSERPAAPESPMTWTASGSGNMEWAAVGLALQASDGAAGRLPEAVKLSVETPGCHLGGRSPVLPGTSGSIVALLLGIWALGRRNLVQSAPGTGTNPDRSRGTNRLMRQSTFRRTLATVVPSPPAPAAPEAAESSDLDEVTLARAKAGDPAAQTALVHRYERPVFALLWRMVGPQRAVVEDLTQETFLRVLRGIRAFEYDGRARLITWILTIATRLALGHLRACKPHRDTAIAPGSVPVALPRPDQDVQRRALAVALVQAVEGLGDPFRAAFMLREVHGLSYDEIASALDIDIGTVKSRLARARAFLQAALAGMRDE